MRADQTDIPTIESRIAYFQIRIERDTQNTRIHIPPLPSLRDLPRAYLWGLVPLIVATAMTFQAISRRPGGAGPRLNIELLFIAGFYASIALCIILVGLQQMRRSIILELCPSEIRLLKERRGAPILLGAWSLSEIGVVHINRSNGNLLIPLHKRDPVEIYLTPCRRVNQWICSSLQQAIREPNTSTEPPDNSIWYASEYNVEQWTRQSMRSRRFQIGVTASLFILSVVMFFTTLPALGFLILIFSGAQAGILLGTQKKDYFM